MRRLRHFWNTLVEFVEKLTNYRQIDPDQRHVGSRKTPREIKLERKILQKTQFNMTVHFELKNST